MVTNLSTFLNVPKKHFFSFSSFLMCLPFSFLLFYFLFFRTCYPFLDFLFFSFFIPVGILFFGMNCWHCQLEIHSVNNGNRINLRYLFPPTASKTFKSNNINPPFFFFPFFFLCLRVLKFQWYYNPDIRNPEARHWRISFNDQIPLNGKSGASNSCAV